MERLLTKAELEQQLNGKRADIDARVDALKSEFTSAGDDARRFFVEQPLKVAGGVVAAGVIVGLLVAGGRSRRSNRRGRKSHRELIERYADLLAKDVRRRLRRGADEDSALRAAFKNRMPLIVMEAESQPHDEDTKGIVREVLDLALKTALGFMVKVLVDRLAEQVDVEGQVDRMVTGMMGSAPSADADSLQAEPPASEPHLG